MPNKILELKNGDWLKGQSIHPSTALGGLFQVFGGSNPFEVGGTATPSYLPLTKTASVSPSFLTPFNAGGLTYIHNHGGASLERYLTTSPYTFTSKTAQINQNLSGNTVTRLLNTHFWKNSYIYVNMINTTLVQFNNNAIDVALASDFTMRNELTDSVANQADRVGDFVPLCVGSDGNLYGGHSQYIYVMSALGTGACAFPGTSTGNTVKYKIDDGFNVRDIQTDGRYLIILADDNQIRVGSRLVGNYRVQVYFWDMVKTQSSGTVITPDAKYEFTDSWAIGTRYMDGAVYLLTYNGISICNSVAQPRLLRPFPTTESINFGRPLHSKQMHASKGTIYWIDGTGTYGGAVFAYGNPVYGQPKVMSRPFSNAVTGEVVSALTSLGDSLVIGSNLPGIYTFNSSGNTTRGNLQITTLNYVLDKPVKYDYTKITATDKLSSGQSITLSVYSRGGTQLISTETKSYNSSNPKQTFCFKRVPTTTNQPDRLEDITLVLTTIGCGLQRITSYGTPQPQEDANDDI